MTTARRIEFGIQANPQKCMFEELLAIWQTAEREGLDHAWTFDHVLPTFMDSAHPVWEGWTALAALMIQTPRLRAGVLVTNNSFRHPALLARMAATLDHATGGRLEMGLGAGWAEDEYRVYGFDFPRIGERMDAMDEALQFLRSLWTQPRTTFRGRHYTLIDAPCEPKPVQQPHMPLWVGGAGRTRTLRAAARYADGWNVWMLPRDEYRLALAALERYCEQAGRDPASVRKSILTAFAVDPDRERALVHLRANSPEVPDEFATAHDHALVGTPDDIASQLQELAELGVDHIVLVLTPSFDHEALEAFAHEVIPRVRAAGL